MTAYWSMTSFTLHPRLCLAAVDTPPTVNASNGPEASQNIEAEDAPVAIQQVSWSESTLPPSHYASSVVATRPVNQVVRDNAPSSFVVISCLVGFGVFSLMLFLSSLPHYWFLGDTRNWRAKKGW